MKLEPDQYRWWITARGKRLSVVRLLFRLTERDTQDPAYVGAWYIEDMKTNGRIFVRPINLGDVVPDLLVIAMAAQ